MQQTDPLLEKSIGAVLTDAPGQLSIAITDAYGARLRVDADRVVTSASTIKIAILLTALEQVQRGQRRLDQALALPSPAQRVGSAGALALTPSVLALPLVEALRLMIALSDNDATNAVIDLLGMAAINEFAQRSGCRATCLRRRMMDFAAKEAGVDNETTAEDLTTLLVGLRTGRLLDAERTDAALEILRTQQDLNGVAAYLPEDVTVASKTGGLTGVRHDAALLERAGHWCCVVVLATGLAEDGPGGLIDMGTSVLPVQAFVGAVAATALLPPT